jgi:hypothetical protein
MSSLKYPIWIRDKKTGKVERIPYEHMIHNNGRYVLNPHILWNTQTIDFFSRYHEYFELEPNADYYVFLGKLNRMARLGRLIRHMLWAACGANTSLAIVNFHTGHWGTGIFSIAAALIAASTYYLGNKRTT